MDKELNYNDILDNFEQFCDEFEGAASRRFSGLDDDSRQPIKHESVERVTPVVVKEVDPIGVESLQLRDSPIDVQASEV